MTLFTALLMFTAGGFVILLSIGLQWLIHRNDRDDDVIDLALERSVRNHPANTNVTVLGWQGNVREFREGARR